MHTELLMTDVECASVAMLVSKTLELSRFKNFTIHIYPIENRDLSLYTIYPIEIRDLSHRPRPEPSTWLCPDPS